VFLRWLLTVVFGAATVWSASGRWVSRPGDPATGTDRISDLLHALLGIAMIVMVWPWGMAVPAGPQIVVFALATIWFLRLALVPPRSGAAIVRPRWSLSLHHAVMAGTMLWLVATIPAVPSVLTVGMRSHPQHQMPAMGGTGPGVRVVVGVVLAGYFLLAALACGQTATGPGRRRPRRGVGAPPAGQVRTVLGRRGLFAVSHAVLSVGMGVLLLTMV
jgi:hypothetical protein